MAFSIRKIISNISYFSTSGDGDSSENEVHNDLSSRGRRPNYFPAIPVPENVEFAKVGDSLMSANNSLPHPVKNITPTRVSYSDTDALMNAETTVHQERKKCRKLKVDIKKATSAQKDLDMSEESTGNVENTPKHKLLDCKNTELFKNFNFNQSFDISDVVSDASTYDDDNFDIETLSEQTESESEDTEDGAGIKMCRKVEPDTPSEPVPSATPESFADVEIDKNEEERTTLLINYQIRIEKLECLLKRMFQEFKFHIEVSKVFSCKSIVPALPQTDLKSSENAVEVDNNHRNISPADWNIIMEKEDLTTRNKIKNQLVSVRNCIDMFINTHLQEKPKLSTQRRSITFDLHKGKRHHKKHQVSSKKKIKHYDFPDLRDAFLNLFNTEDYNESFINEEQKCRCCCHSDSESTASIKDTNHSITSSIGNFTLDSSTLTAYSESLDYIISYNSFEDSLYTTILQKSAIERITFYVQVHSVQLNCDTAKNIISFYCPACSINIDDEQDLLRHILSPNHCEKIHFLYKTAYVKKCIVAGKEIMPSTILNPMTMYRDENKIVCFGDAMYACSLCFENLIVGESVLMAHCSDDEHVTRREMMVDVTEV